MAAVPAFPEDVGWVRVDHILTPERAAELAARCASLADDLEAPGPADKPHGGTRRLGELLTRLPEVTDLVADLGPIVERILPDGAELMEVAWRCPGPGFGAQRLHADDTPKLDDGPARCATAIVALVDFTEDNGSTRVVPGSHLRPDLQRSSGTLDHHPDEVRLTGPAGSAFVFTGHLLHSGTENRSSAPRPALQVSFRAPDAGR